MDDGQLGLDLLIGFLAGCRDYDDVDGGTRVVMLPEFGMHGPLSVTGVAVRYIAGSDDPPTVAIEYRPVPGAPVPEAEVHKLALEIVGAWDGQFTAPAGAGQAIDYQMAVLAAQTVLRLAGRTAVPRMCVLCGHAERGHRIPPGMGGARWPLDEMDCSQCPGEKCRAGGLAARPLRDPELLGGTA
jgi:hypothetical protein